MIGKINETGIELFTKDDFNRIALDKYNIKHPHAGQREYFLS